MTVDVLLAKNEKFGMVVVNRPCSIEHLVEAIPTSVKTIAVIETSMSQTPLANRYTQKYSQTIKTIPLSPGSWPFSKTC